MTRSDCSSIPQYPICGASPQDSLGDMCRFSFDKSFRLQNRGNPTITSVCPVACPPQLYQATGLRRMDETNSLFKCNQNALPERGSLTKTMDCSKSPSSNPNSRYSILFLHYSQRSRLMPGWIKWAVRPTQVFQWWFPAEGTDIPG